jgi:hypothetical protein
VPQDGGFCEEGNETSGAIKWVQFDSVKNCQLPKKYSTSWRFSFFSYRFEIVGITNSDENTTEVHLCFTLKKNFGLT